MPQRFFLHTFENGLTLLGEKLPAVQSAAMTLLLPAGSSGDPPHRAGAATVLSELVLRGTGARDSRQLSDYLDTLGLVRSSSAGVYHARFACAGLADRVIESIPAYADIVRRPQLPPDGFAAARDQALQALEGLKDDPRQTLLVKLRERFLPFPLGRNPIGEKSDLKKLTLDSCRRLWRKSYQANGAILALAGNIDFPRFKNAAAKSFSDLPAFPQKTAKLVWPSNRAHHVHQKSEQTHIGIAYTAAPETDAHYYAIRAACEAFGGGMSSRLFTEIREKRALCYSVWAGYTSVKSIGSILCYAGSSNDRAQATLDCILAEIHRLTQGITEGELERAKIGLKAATIMQGESTSARCAAIAQDYFMHGRIRTLTEIEREIDRLTVKSVNDYLRDHPPGKFTIVTVGPKPLKI